MGWPQVTMIVLLAMAVGINLAKHGQPRTPYHGVYAAICAAVQAGILWAGGFW